MKRFILFGVLAACFSFVSGQSNQWTWIQGDSTLPYYAVYGVKGVAAPGNTPGGREFALRWKGADGSFWLYGGYGNTLTQSGYTSDLWKYSPVSGLWTWIGGDTLILSKIVYGTKGVAAPGNTPGARTRSGTWTDSAGNLWLFGLDARTDFWKYSPPLNQWIWMGGDTVNNQPPVYTIKGVPSPVAKPGSRATPVTWVDRFGNFWLFGGGSMADLWKYNFATEQWTWVSGEKNFYGVATVPGTQLVPAAGNTPGYRSNAVTWTDSTGNLWMYGGYGSSASSDVGNLSDLWRFTPANGYWTWMTGSPYLGSIVRYGTRGLAANTNSPGSRTNATGFADSGGNLWVFGGIGSGSDGTTVFNDLWKYNPTTNLWTWIKGTPTIATYGFNGTKGIPGPDNLPGGRQGMASWIDASSKLWIFGGVYTFIAQGPHMSDLWQYDLTTDQWAWMGGDNSNTSRTGTYGTKGSAASGNKPGERLQSVGWADKSGDFWLFGGSGYAQKGALGKGPLNDLWKWAPSTGLWTWMNGDTAVYPYASYGKPGVATSTNKPGARYGSAGWTDTAGNMWMFGGSGQATPQIGPRIGASGTLNDLWKYDPSTNLWTWMHGYNLAQQPGIYGTKGVAAANNVPAPRYNAVSWKDTSGNYWLFGGLSDAISNSGFLNDLWMYSPATNQWTWKSGDATTNQTGIYGALGTSAATNKPGARHSAVGWTDSSGNLWLFGGITTGTFLSYLNDLWKYSPSTGQWTWMGGDNTVNTGGAYGVQGVASVLNKPSSRQGAVGWTDNSGNFWLFGGQGFYSHYNDLWTYSPATLQWTWVGGDKAIDQIGLYGTAGFPSAANKPGARYQAIGWKDLAGNLRLWGGNGFGANGFGTLNDSWLYTLVAAVLPVRFSSFTARQQATLVLLNWTTAHEQNSREFVVEHSTDSTVYAPIGTVAAAGTVNTETSYAFTDVAPHNGDNFYRIREVDKNGRSMYSSLQKVFFGDVLWNFSVMTNPVRQELTVNLLLPVQQVLQLQVRDAAGHLKINRQVNAPKGSSQLHLPVDRFAAGTYFLQIGSASLQGTRAFVKQ